MADAAEHHDAIFADDQAVGSDVTTTALHIQFAADSEASLIECYFKTKRYKITTALAENKERQLLFDCTNGIKTLVFCVWNYFVFKRHTAIRIEQSQIKRNCMGMRRCQPQRSNIE